MNDTRAYFDELNRTYSSVHKTKEDLFWTTYMATSDDQAGFARAENAYKDFISDPARLAATRDHLARLQRLPPGEERDALLHGLKGWLALFEANIIDSDEGRALMRDDHRRRGRALREEARVAALATSTSTASPRSPRSACWQPIRRPIPWRSAAAVPSTPFARSSGGCWTTAFSIW